MTLKGGKYINNNLTKTQPLFSIITVVFNGEKHIARTIESIINQQYDNFEYIIIDGASKDKTLEIIKKYESYIDLWISESDKSLYDAMNKGLKLAKGEYVCFINCGDELSSNTILNELADFIINKKTDSIYSDTIVIDENGKEIGLLSKLTHNNAPENLSWKHFGKGMVVCHQSFVAKRIRSPFFDINYKYSADIDWIIRFLITNPNTIKFNKCISKFMIGGLSQHQFMEGMKERYKLLQKHFGFWRNLINHISILPRILKRFLVKKRITNF